MAIITVKQLKVEASQLPLTELHSKVKYWQSRIMSAYLASCYGGLDSGIQRYENALRVYVNERDYRMDFELVPSGD